MTEDRLHLSISLQSIALLTTVLKNGQKINHKSKKNTLNYAICTFLSKTESKFNLEYLAFLIHFIKASGGKICSKDQYNTLTLTIKCSKQYILNAKDKILAEKNILELLHLLILNGAEPSGAQDFKSNTLTAAIETGNLKIVQVIAESNPLPDNGNKNYHCNGMSDKRYTDNLNTLTYAVNTNNLKIIKIAIKCGATPHNGLGWCNTVVQAIIFGNQMDQAPLEPTCKNSLEIVEEIIIIGGKPNDNAFYDFLNDFKINIHVADKLINLLMCSGAVVSKYIYDQIIQKKEKTVIDLKLLDCYIISLLVYVDKNTWNANDQIHKDRINKLLKRLEITTNNLVNKATGLHELVERLPLIPVCCIDIIHQYRRDQPSFSIIDWTKFRFKS